MEHPEVWLEEFVQVMHDMKSPLTTISLESQMLDLQLLAADTRGAGQAVERINRNVTYIDRMIHDLLDMCAIDAGKLQLRRVKTDLGLLVEAVLDRVVCTRDRARVSFTRAPVTLTLSLDDLRIERVIANLIDNAMKYAPCASGIAVHVDATADHASVSVIDAGPGVHGHDRAVIFERYRRARGSDAVDGNGLGLYVSKRIIDAHGGRIGVHSVAGQGARFFFDLPLE